MSLESNISNKAREKFNNRDLFEHLTYDDPYAYELREDGSLRPKTRNTEGMVEEVGYKVEQKMSVEGEVGTGVGHAVVHRP